MSGYSNIKVFNYSKKRYKLVFSILLLVVAILFAAIWMTLLYFDKLTNQVDKIVVNQYHDFYNNKEQKALIQLQSGNTEAIKNCLKEEFSDIKKGDRVYPFKRNLLLKLTEELYNKQQFKELSHWSTIWHDGDGRDVTAKVYYYIALFHTPGKEEEALKKLEEIKINFPKNKLLKKIKI